MTRQESAAKVRRVLADGDGCVARSTNGPLAQKPKHAAAEHFRVEVRAAQRLPATMRTGFNVAASAMRAPMGVPRHLRAFRH